MSWKHGDDYELAKTRYDTYPEYRQGEGRYFDTYGQAKAHSRAEAGLGKSVSGRSGILRRVGGNSPRVYARNILDVLRTSEDDGELLRQSAIKGDVLGHPFHGNQYRAATNSRKSEQNQTEIIHIARELELRPRPSGEIIDMWTAWCPGTGHRLFITASDNEFFCPWCKRKGGTGIESVRGPAASEPEIRAEPKEQRHVTGKALQVVGHHRPHLSAKFEGAVQTGTNPAAKAFLGVIPQELGANVFRIHPLT